MIVIDPILEKYLIEKLNSVIDSKSLAQAVETAHSFNIRLDEVLLDKSLVKEDDIGQIIAEYLGVGFVNLKNQSISEEIINIIPEEISRHHKIIIFNKTDNRISVAMQDPKNFETIEYLRKKTGFDVTPFYSQENDIIEALNRYKGTIKEEFSKIISQSISNVDNISVDPREAAKEVSIIKVLDTLFDFSISEKASDIHIEGVEQNVVIRFRIDGVLHDMISLSKILHPAIVARIKVLASLKLDEHRSPQDGRFKYSRSGLDVAFRVSIIPAFYGENVVLRLLPESERPKTLEELGFSGENLKNIKDNLAKSHGMILVTGPTGSGKTTTLYSLLNIINSPEVKICTVEDPIEYGIRRISQIQVNTVTGLTFAKGLRSLLRHDPDIIMVGEIRDKETASIAINSALTGHLVLSTIHTNDAPSAIPRFLDLGIEGFLLASTVNVVLGQRLVRKLCQSCIVENKIDDKLLQNISNNFNVGLEKLRSFSFFIGKGCGNCHQSGYQGRIGIYEIFEIDDEIRELILQKISVNKLMDTAIKKGMVTMFEDGLQKANQKITSLEEIVRVARE